MNQQNKTSALKEEINFDNVYYCTKCNRFTDVNYIRDVIDKSQRPKSCCYLCNKELTMERVSDLIRHQLLQSIKIYFQKKSNL